MVHPVDEIERSAILDRRADHDLSRPGGEVGRDPGGRLEGAGAVDHQIDAELRQRQRLDRLFMRQGDGRAVQHQRTRLVPDRRAPAAVHAVELHQQRVLFGIAHRIVQKHDVAARPAGVDQVAQHQLADPAKTVESDAGHAGSPLCAKRSSPPMASTRDCSDIRLRPSNGSSTKAAIRRRSAA